MEVWQLARGLVGQVYRITAHFPAEERFGLVSQMRRAAISVMANIAEGSKRQTVKDRTHFHVIADTSLEELKCYFVVSYDLDYIGRQEGEVMTQMARKIGGKLTRLTQSLKPRA